MIVIVVELECTLRFYADLLQSIIYLERRMLQE